MRAELISTGTELLLGQIVNTNAQYIAQRLATIGVDLFFQTTVGDNPERLCSVLEHALSRADVVITTGGLGPTMGDLTKEMVAKVLDLDLVLDEDSLKRIERFFHRRGIPMTDNNRKQAMIPQTAQVIPNRYGTAPGIIVEKNGKIIICLPGPPREMEPLFEESVVPFLRQKTQGASAVIKSKVLRTYGIGESILEEKIKDILRMQNNPTIALLAKDGEIHVRITAKAGNEAEANELIKQVEKRISERIQTYIFATFTDAETPEPLEMVVGKLLLAKQLTISLAESCTGGLISERLTNVPGISAVYECGIISYSNRSKITLLNVPKHIIDTYGAVSRETAIAMAEGIRRASGTELGLAVTGIAGPDGGTKMKPVGLVYLALSDRQGTQCQELNFPGERIQIRHRTAIMALHLLRQYLLAI